MPYTCHTHAIYMLCVYMYICVYIYVYIYIYIYTYICRSARRKPWTPPGPCPSSDRPRCSRYSGGFLAASGKERPRTVSMSTTDISQACVMTVGALLVRKPLTHRKTFNHRWNRNPRPQPQKSSKLAFLVELYKLISHLSILVIWGSSWGRGFRCHCSTTCRRHVFFNRGE